jgi:8-amino-7-oxononanoate synthase
MKSFPVKLTEKLNSRKEDNALRILGTGNSLIDFSSNDYLGFSKNNKIFRDSHEYLIDYNFTQNGSTGSRLLTGNHGSYKIAEDFIADFHEAESALIFNSGYDVNVGFFSSVPQKGDVVLYDEYIHASIRDGLRLSSALTYKYPHNDLNALEGLLKRHSDRVDKGEVYIITESVFSMDGDSPDLRKIAGLGKEYNSRVVVDEAHALGVFGANGSGLAQSLGIHGDIFARIITFGKALGCHGAAVLGATELKQYLVNFARSFIYTTALPPHSLATLLAAYKELMNNPAEKQKLNHNIGFFNSEIERLRLQNFIQSYSAIQCAVTPGNNTVKEMAATLQQKGFDVKAILSPTVAQGQERLRFCLHSYNTKEEITNVLSQLTMLIAQR